MRHHKRGANSSGFCANFVETEQIVELKKKIFSFVIIRGSIPLSWKQTPSIDYKPPTTINEKKSTESSTNHFKYLINKYKNAILINLVDNKGSEKKLADQFEKNVKNFGSDNLKFFF
jgi:phosphatidylinositol 4-phosphatase